jgi:translocator protein
MRFRDAALRRPDPTGIRADRVARMIGMETSSTASTRDLVRAVIVTAFALGQVASAGLTPVLLSAPDTGAISDANNSPVTPAGYAFSIWGLIYLASLALAVYQLLPAQRVRPVHRRTGWWLAGAFACSTVWVPIFNSNLLMLAQVVIVLLVICLGAAAIELTRLGAAAGTGERLLLRLPVTLYLGWATLACLASFATTGRWLGMPAEAGWVTVVSMLLVAIGTVVSLAVVTRLTAVAGYAFTSCWALVAVAVGTYVPAVRWIAIAGLLVVLAGLVLRTVRDRQASSIALLG